MSESALTFIRDEMPTWFERGLEALQLRAEQGDERARRRHDDAIGARGTALVEVGGEGRVWLVVDSGRMQAATEPPAEPATRLALRVPADAMHAAVAELRSRMQQRPEEVTMGLAAAPSKRADEVIGERALGFHVAITGVPDLGDVTVEVGIGVAEPPETPGFTATVRYEDLEAASEGDLDPQALMMGGRIRFTGDYAPALQLAMELSRVL